MKRVRSGIHYTNTITSTKNCADITSSIKKNVREAFFTWTFVPKELISKRSLPNDTKFNFINILDAVLASMNMHNLSLSCHLIGETEKSLSTRVYFFPQTKFWFQMQLIKMSVS